MKIASFARLTAALAVVSVAECHFANAQGTAFTYQGFLTQNGQLVRAPHDLAFTLYNAVSNGAMMAPPVTLSSVPVANGLFNVTIDFGISPFNGDARWLEIAARPTGGGAFDTLTPRQPITPTPYATFAGGVNAAGISGTIVGSQLASGAAAANLATTGATLLSTNPNATNLIAAGYVKVGGQLDLSWQQRRSDLPRAGPSAIWTGNKMIVWGGVVNGDGITDTGRCYDPVANSWLVVTTSNTPQRRYLHTAIWTGTKMIIWGGSYSISGPSFYLNTGGCYDPQTDSWMATTTANAPSNRDQHTAVWTGSEMIVWGGKSSSLTTFNDGARYNPTNDSWTQITITNAPSERYWHTAIWTGTEMIIWGGSFWNGSQMTDLNSGGRYNPMTDTWSPVTTNGAPAARLGHSAVWTGSEMIISGGEPAPVSMNVGARYNPTTDTWTLLPTNGAPSVLSQGRLTVWTGSDMIVWGGDLGFSQSGARYNPAANSWSPVPSTGAPSVRGGFNGLWTGNEMLLFGGRSIYDNTLLGDIYAYTPSRVMYLYLRP